MKDQIYSRAVKKKKFLVCTFGLLRGRENQIHAKSEKSHIWILWQIRTFCPFGFLVKTDVLVSIPDDTSNEAASTVSSIGLAVSFSQGLELQDSPASRLPGAIALPLQESLALGQSNKLCLT